MVGKIQLANNFLNKTETIRNAYNLIYNTNTEYTHVILALVVLIGILCT